MVDIRGLEPDDPQALANLIEAVEPTGSSTTGLEHQATFLTDPSTFVLGGYVVNQPVAFAWGNLMPSPDGRLTTYLHKLAVHEAWRRQGIATAIVTEAMKLGKQRGSTRFWLTTAGRNEDAQALYDSLGGDRKELGDVNYWWQLA